MKEEEVIEDLPSIYTEDAATWYDPTRLEKVRRKPARSANAVHDAFDLIGGVPRLAAWANDNPNEFYSRLFTKTIERATKSQVSGQIRIISAIPRGALDGEVEDAEFTDV